jgi:hypothetical protein
MASGHTYIHISSGRGGFTQLLPLFRGSDHDLPEKGAGAGRVVVCLQYTLTSKPRKRTKIAKAVGINIVGKQFCYDDPFI